MIAQLKGTVDQLGDGFVLLDVHGVGYRVFASAKCLGRLVIGQAVTLQIETHVREDHIHLYGFSDSGERGWFTLLTTVQGVGTKVALAILSVSSPDELLRGLAAQDRTVFARANGVGPKLAARLLSELKGKAGTISLGGSGAVTGDTAIPADLPQSAVGGGGVLEDAVSALVNLGYRRLEAFDACGAALNELKAAGAESEPDQSTLIRLALRRLGKDMGR